MHGEVAMWVASSAKDSLPYRWEVMHKEADFGH